MSPFLALRKLAFLQNRTYLVSGNYFCDVRRTEALYVGFRQFKPERKDGVDLKGPGSLNCKNPVSVFKVKKGGVCFQGGCTARERLGTEFLVASDSSKYTVGRRSLFWLYSIPLTSRKSERKFLTDIAQFCTLNLESLNKFIFG